MNIFRGGAVHFFFKWVKYIKKYTIEITIKWRIIIYNHMEIFSKILLSMAGILMETNDVWILHTKKIPKKKQTVLISQQLHETDSVKKVTYTNKGRSIHLKHYKPNYCLLYW